MAKKSADSVEGLVETAPEPEVPPILPPAPAPAPAAAPAASARETYGIVATAVTLSWGGQFIRLSVGDVVSEESYGMGAIARMREAGVAFE